MRHTSALVLGFSCALLAACSEGTEATATFSTGGPGGGGVGGEAGTGGAGGDTSSSTSTSASGTGGTSGVGGNAGTGGSAGTGGASGACDAQNTCEMAEEITGITGDKDSTATRTGSSAKWFTMLVKEDSFGILDKPLSFTATLESPPGVDYDLFLYEGDLSGASCLGNAFLATGMPESISRKWDDNNGDSGRWMILEVRLATGTPCGAGDWTLTVKGRSMP